MDEGAPPMVATSEEVLALAGRRLGPTPWLEVSQEQVDGFASSVHDWHWAHNDPAAAAAGPFSGTIAHAHWTLSAVPHLRRGLFAVERGELMFYGYDRVRFPGPVRVGARVRMQATVVSVEEIPLGEQLTLDLEIEVDGQDRPACVARAVWRRYVLDEVT